MTETITISLNKLDVDPKNVRKNLPKNVRKTYSAEGIAALAGSIRADGYRLLQNFVVRKGDKKGRCFVDRWRATPRGAQSVGREGRDREGFSR
ncbi:hypothetical protein [Mesorhizobium sp. M0408]|uniref:hypothetical protein n=1 Tax=Mesorhizobium sp. M0408 TaxID=2956942 RepID=UPI003335FB07